MIESLLMLAAAVSDAHLGAWQVQVRTDPINDSIFAASQATDNRNNRLVVWCSSAAFDGSLNTEIQWQMSQPYSAVNIEARLDKGAPFTTPWVLSRGSSSTMNPYTVVGAHQFIAGLQGGQQFYVRLGGRQDLTTAFQVAGAAQAFERVRSACASAATTMPPTGK